MKFELKKKTVEIVMLDTTALFSTWKPNFLANRITETAPLFINYRNK